jgi:hypothetical protein
MYVSQPIMYRLFRLHSVTVNCCRRACCPPAVAPELGAATAKGEYQTDVFSGSGCPQVTRGRRELGPA